MTALGAVATGAAAVGNAAIGQLAVGRAAVGRLVIRSAKVKRLEIDELTVHQMQLAGPPGIATRERASEWVAAYERAWRTAGTEPLAELFTADAIYTPGPWEEPHRGLDAIAAFWAKERQSPDEAFTFTSTPVAVDGDTAIVRTDVIYDAPRNTRFRNLWVIAFTPDGHVRSFEEWPIAPGEASS
jgi:uncharacterized protein (TIGR02246 family)